MHPDFNPKFSHLKPFIVFFTLFTKDAQPAAMQAVWGKGRSGRTEGGRYCKKDFWLRVLTTCLRKGEITAFCSILSGWSHCNRATSYLSIYLLIYLSIWLHFRPILTCALYLHIYSGQAMHFNKRLSLNAHRCIAIIMPSDWPDHIWRLFCPSKIYRQLLPPRRRKNK